MLNRFKIGVKLIGGFVGVLILLGVVWFMGWYSVREKTHIYKELSDATALARAGVEVSRDISDIMIGLRDLTINREQKYADDIKNRIATLKGTHQKDTDKMAKQQSKDNWKIIMDNLDKADGDVAEYWKVETQRRASRDKRANLADMTQKALEELEKGVRDSTKSEKWAITQDGKTFIPLHRVELAEIIADIACLIREARKLSYQYDFSIKEDEQQNLRTQIEQICGTIIAKSHEVEEQVESDANKTRAAAIKKNIEDWHEAVTQTMDLDKNLKGIATKTLDCADIANTTADKTVEDLFDVRAKAARDASDAFDIKIVRFLAGVSLCAILFGLVISIALTRNITAGMSRTTGIMQLVASEGDITIEIPPADMNRDDEVGDLAKATTVILQQFKNVEQLADALANGDYTAIAKVRGDKDSMNIYLNKMLDQTNHVLSEINEGVGQVATGSGEVSNAAQNLSSGAQESAASLEEITASMSEISSQTKANAESASQARDLANKASHAAAEGQSAMKDMTSAMERITQNSSEIQRVIKVIDDIAFQTNLLALNAAVEAARAGQHGKGFAVVAEEVRNLASRSAKAARETSDLIAKSGSEIEKGGEVASHTASVLDTIVEQIKQTTDLVAGIAVASNEQAQGVNQVTIGLQQIDSVTQQNTAAAEESASAANEMSSMAANLQKLVAQFKLRS